MLLVGFAGRLGTIEHRLVALSAVVDSSQNCLLLLEKTQLRVQDLTPFVFHVRVQECRLPRTGNVDGAGIHQRPDLRRLLLGFAGNALFKVFFLFGLLGFFFLPLLLGLLILFLFEPEPLCLGCRGSCDLPVPWICRRGSCSLKARTS